MAAVARAVLASTKKVTAINRETSDLLHVAREASNGTPDTANNLPLFTNRLKLRIIHHNRSKHRRPTTNSVIKGLDQCQLH